jgi:transposase InsO family protein
MHGDRCKRARGLGWEFVHVCVDDATRLAYVEVPADERAPTRVAFLRRAVAHVTALGVRVEQVRTDNGNGYRSLAHALACRTLGLRHLHTRPYRPRTNGKAERFIRTLLASWAHGAVYTSSRARTAALAGWLDFYNRRRAHEPVTPAHEQRPWVLHLESPGAGGEYRFIRLHHGRCPGG